MPIPDKSKPWINDVGDYEVIEKQTNSLMGYLKNAGFMTAIANLEWSRGYTWYVELDDVPFPFQRGGVIGLPVTDVTYEICHPDTFSWSGGLETFEVPKGRKQSTLNLEVLDDEQATIFTFFERWYNNIYNNRAGVLPVVEAAKCISIYKLKATRTPVKRYAYRYDMREDKIGDTVEKVIDARELLVYPTNSLQEQEKYESNPRKYNIEFNIVNQENPDFGNPALHEGSTIFGFSTEGHSFLDKASHYF